MPVFRSTTRSPLKPAHVKMIGSVSEGYVVGKEKTGLQRRTRRLPPSRATLPPPATVVTTPVTASMRRIRLIHCIGNVDIALRICDHARWLVKTGLSRRSVVAKVVCRYDAGEVAIFPPTVKERMRKMSAKITPPWGKDRSLQGRPSQPSSQRLRHRNRNSRGDRHFPR